MGFKYGKLAATEDSRDLKLGAYIDDAAVLPKIPASWGTTDPFPAGWGLLGNDTWGDCAIAGPAHETMLWTKEGTGHAATFTDACVLSDYSAITGFDPNDPSTDQGSNVRTVAGYRKRVGMIDASGKRHKIAGYVSIDHRNLAHVLAAGFLFDAVGIGFQVPASAQEQFGNRQPWTVVPGSPIEGGHYVPLVGADLGWLYIVTWGRVQKMSRQFFAKYADETWGYLSTEFLHGGKSPDGFNLTQLRADLAAL